MCVCARSRVRYTCICLTRCLLRVSSGRVPGSARVFGVRACVYEFHSSFPVSGRASWLCACVCEVCVRVCMNFTVPFLFQGGLPGSVRVCVRCACVCV